MPWSEALTTEALSNLPENATVGQKAAAMQELVQKLRALKEFLRWDPKTMDAVAAKENPLLLVQVRISP